MEPLAQRLPFFFTGTCSTDPSSSPPVASPDPVGAATSLGGPAGRLTLRVRVRVITFGGSGVLTDAAVGSGAGGVAMIGATGVVTVAGDPAGRVAVRGGCG